jgi:apolipoprotein N-acyltransferase
MMARLGLLCLGALVATGQAPLGAFWLAIPALAGVFGLLSQAGSAREWFGRMWLAGVGFFAASLFWIIEPFFIEPEIHGWMAPFALVFMAGGMALFWAIAGWIAARLAHGRARLLALAVALVALELARGHLFGGFPWAMLGHALIDTPMRAGAAYGGAGGLSLVVVLAALAPVLWRVRGGVAAVSMLAALWLWGGAQTTLPPDRAQVVRLIQPNAPQAEKWLGDNPRRFFFRQVDQTATPADTPPDLVIWPETAVPFLLENPGEGLQIMADALATHGTGAKLAFGVQREEAGRYFNTLAVLDTDAQVRAIYDKHHLVPFGEYIPFAELLTGTRIGGLAGQMLDGYSPGPGPALLDMGALGQVLPLICYEAIFPRHARHTPRPDWLLQITNDGWFGDLTGPYQHLAQARLRAVETGLPLIRVANTGVSAVIDARGGVVAQLALGHEGFLDAPLPGALPVPPYARWGDWPVWALLSALLAVSLLWSRRPLVSGARTA